jgi:hypothetical protein
LVGPPAAAFITLHSALSSRVFVSSSLKFMLPSHFP